MATSTPTTTTTSSSPFPTLEKVQEIMSYVTTPGSSQKFASHLAPDGHFKWSAKGTTPMSGTFTTQQEIYNSLKSFHDTHKAKPRFELLGLIYDRTTGQAAVRWQCRGECWNGMRFDGEIAWMLRFNEATEIVEMHEFFDTALITKAIEAPDNQGHAQTTGEFRN